MADNLKYHYAHPQLLIKPLAYIQAIIISVVLIWPMFASTTSQAARQLEAMAATTLASTNTNSTMLGNPIFVEHDKETNSKPIVINGTQGVATSFSGNGTIKGLDFTSHGMFLVLFKPDRFWIS